MAWLALTQDAAIAAPDLVLHGGRIVTVDAKFSIHQAIAIDQGRIAYLGSDEAAIKLAGPATEVIDLQGKMVLPGLIDSHVHPAGAAMHEADHPIPEMKSVADVLAYVRSRAAVVPEGEWIEVRQVFITRLDEQRYPSRAELDNAASRHPVLFATGPDASLNSLALEKSGIDRDFVVAGPGIVEKDEAGEPTGILRSCTRYVKVESKAPPSSDRLRYDRLKLLLADYNATGLTTIADRDAAPDEIDLYRALGANDDLPIRVAISHSLDAAGKFDDVAATLDKIASDPLARANLAPNQAPRLSIVGVKTYLDGGMLTGSAYMRDPWGVSDVYGIRDPRYRGVLFLERERLLPVVRAALERGLQFTAHAVGDAAVELLVDVYEEIDRELPVRSLRPCVTHANFQSAATIRKAASLGVVMDVQPVWLHLDAKTLTRQFGSERMKSFQPLAALFLAGVTVGGGSDHMQKIGRDRSVNLYNPFLGIETAVTRRARGLDQPVHAAQSLTREQALRMYTINNARLLFLEQHVGSLEAGKLADLIVVDRDLLSCPVDDIDGTQVLATYIEGKKVHSK